MRAGDWLDTIHKAGRPGPSNVEGRSWKSLSLLLLCVVLGCASQQQQIEPPTPLSQRTSAEGISATATKPTSQSQAVSEKELLSRAVAGDVDAQVSVALLYTHYQLYAKALSFAEKAASRGNHKARVLRSALHKEHGEALPSSEVVNAFSAGAASAESMPEVRQLADAGDTEAQLILWFDKGNWLFVTSHKTHWLKKAIANGSPMAKAQLGLAYRWGTGVKQDLHTALQLFQEAAEEGDAVAMVGLGNLYGTGVGVPQNQHANFEWKKKAALKGYWWAQFDLAFMYAEGLGPQKNSVRALAWANQFAAHDTSMWNLPSGPLGKYFGQKKRLSGPQVKHLVAFGLSREQINAAEQLTLDELAQEPVEVVAETPSGPPEASGPPSLPEGYRVVISGGTGFFITDSGHLLTNHHVIEDASKVTVFIGGDSLPARLIQAAPSLDLAVLKIEKQVKSIPLASSKGLRMGNAVFTIGFPNTQLQGVRPKYTNGRISSLSGIQDDPRKVQITVPIQPGNSGGPLVDERGNVVGVVSSSLRDRPDEVRQLVNYAVKSSFALAFLETLTDVVELLPRPTTKQATHSVSPIQRVKDATVRIRVERIR